MLDRMLDERIVRFRPRAILTVIGVVLAVAIVLQVLWVTRSVIIWVLIALFLAWRSIRRSSSSSTAG